MTVPGKGGKRVLMVDAQWPDPRFDAGSRHLSQIASSFARLGCSVDLAVLHDRGVPAAFPAHPLRGDAHVHLKRDSQTAHAYDIIVLCRPEVAEALLPLTRAHQPRAKVVYQTMDLHHLRFYREARLTGTRHALLQAMDMKRRELSLARGSDRTWVISHEEMLFLKQSLPDAAIDLVGMIFERGPGMSREKRMPARKPQHAVFVGNFAHRPNVDAVQWLLEEIWPLVMKRVPQASLSVLGGNVPARLREFTSPSVRFTGWIEDLAAVLDHAAIGLAPLRFGAGVKGKIFSYIEHGLAPVLTRVAAEGLAFENDMEAMLADDAPGFAQAVVTLMESPDMAQRMASSACARFAREHARGRLDDAIARSLDLFPEQLHTRTDDGTHP